MSSVESKYQQKFDDLKRLTRFNGDSRTKVAPTRAKFAPTMTLFQAFVETKSEMKKEDDHLLTEKQLLQEHEEACDGFQSDQLTIIYIGHTQQNRGQ